MENMEQIEDNMYPQIISSHSYFSTKKLIFQFKLIRQANKYHISLGIDIFSDRTICKIIL